MNKNAEHSCPLYINLGMLLIALLIPSWLGYAAPLETNSITLSFEPLDTVTLPDLTSDDVSERGVLYVEDEQLRLQVLNGSTLESLSLISWNHIYDDPSLHLLPDLNGNGVAEIAVFGVRNDVVVNASSQTIDNRGKAQLYARDLSTGRNARVYNWPANWTSVKPMILDDITGDGVVDVAIQGRFKVGNRPQLVVRDGSNGSSAGTFSYPDLFNNPEFFQHSDVNGDGVAEISTLGRIKRNNKIQIKIANGASPSNKLKAYNFPDKWENISWVKLDDSNGDSIDDWGLFGTNKQDGRAQLIVKNGTDPKGALRLHAWPSAILSAQFIAIPDINGDGVDEVAAAGLRTNGRHQLQIQNGVDRNEVLVNYNLKLSLENVSYHVLPDLTADGVAEIGFMGIDGDNNYILQVQNGTGGSPIIEYNFGPDWSASPALITMPDVTNDGLSDLLVEGGVDGQTRLEIWAIPDSDNDSYPDTADAFPEDENEWLDTDLDTVGNNADPDDDGDGVPDENDAYPLISLGGLVDTDNDGIPDDCDNACMLLGMNADADDDGDGLPDSGPRLVVGIGSQAPGLDSDFNFGVFRELQFGSDGQVAIIADAINASSETVKGVWLGNPNDLKLVIKTDDSIPEGEDNILFDSADSLSINGKGEVMFRATMKGAVSTSSQYAVLYADSERIQEVEVELPDELIQLGYFTEDHPGKSWFKIADAGAAVTLSLNDASAFQISQGSATWFWTPESSTLVMGTYFTSADIGTAKVLPMGGIASFDDSCLPTSHYVFLDLLTPQINNKGDIAFRTDLAGSSDCPRAALLKWSNGIMTSLVEHGQSIPNMPSDTFLLQSQHAFDVSMRLTDDGDVIFLNYIRISIVESVAGYFVAKEGVEEPQLLVSNREGVMQQPSSSLFISFEDGPKYSSSLGFVVPMLDITEGIPLLLVGDAISNPYETVSDIDESHLSVLLEPGDIPPDFPATSYFTHDGESFVRSSINSTGHYLFYALVSDSTQPGEVTAAGLWNINNNNIIQQVLKIGDDVAIQGPIGDQSLIGIGDFVLTNDNQIMAIVQLANGSVGIMQMEVKTN